MLPEHIDYYLSEWVAASLDAIVSHRLFPSLGLPSSNRVNVIRPTTVSNAPWTPVVSGGSCLATGVWERRNEEGETRCEISSSDLSRGACSFSVGFIPESACHFQVEIPHIESLRAALFSDPKFNLRSPWQLQVTVVLHTTPLRIPGGVIKGNEAISPFSKSHELESSGIRPKEKRSDSLFEAPRRQPVHGGNLGCSSTPGTSRPDVRGGPSPLAALCQTKCCQTRCFLEQWVLSFQPSIAQGRQTTSDNRKLCTALKGLMAAIHFLPTHSALLALAKNEKECGTRGEKGGDRAQQKPHVEVRVCAKWQGQEAKTRRGRCTSATWTPLVYYISDLEDSLTCRSLEGVEDGAGHSGKSVENSCGTVASRVSSISCCGTNSQSF